MSKSKGRRSKKSPASRVRPFWIPILLLLAVVAAGGYYGASWPGFRAKTISVEGNQVVARSQIVASAAIDRRKNIWLQNTGAAATRVRSIPYIEDVRVRRGLPATVTIAVTERKPYAVVADGARAKIIDAQLRFLEPDSGRSDLPRLKCRLVPEPKPGEFLHDECVRSLLHDFQTLGKAHVNAKALDRDRLGDVSAIVVPGISVRLGDDTDLEAKAALIDPILSQTQALGKRVRALDLRAPKTPVVLFQ
ncbi:MAG: FtsQ-type POTRA domain-containing protein [Candidatus Eremiobacteraeota bacterium]|nr:FtsQ-type POTRA domain-containing protein [Candidatus Eremiobacteraeota bacterium]